MGNQLYQDCATLSYSDSKVNYTSGQECGARKKPGSKGGRNKEPGTSEDESFGRGSKR